jgi:predicted oxidoreductase
LVAGINEPAEPLNESTPNAAQIRTVMKESNRQMDNNPFSKDAQRMLVQNAPQLLMV